MLVPIEFDAVRLNVPSVGQPAPRIYMKKYFLAILLTVLTTFAFTSRAGAVSDYTFTITESTAPNTLICSNDTADNLPACSDYSYLKIDSNVSSGYKYVQFRTSSVTSYNTLAAVTSASDMYVISLSSDVYKIRVGGASSLPSTYSITLTFSENSPSVCPTCPESLPPDRSAIMDDFHNVFLKVIVGVIPISAIIFVVWFMIDMLSSLIFGRGR